MAWVGLLGMAPGAGAAPHGSSGSWVPREWHRNPGQAQPKGSQESWNPGQAQPKGAHPFSDQKIPSYCPWQGPSPQALGPWLCSLGQCRESPGRDTGSQIFLTHWDFQKCEFLDFGDSVNSVSSLHINQSVVSFLGTFLSQYCFPMGLSLPLREAKMMVLWLPKSQCPAPSTSQGHTQTGFGGFEVLC